MSSSEKLLTVALSDTPKQSTETKSLLPPTGRPVTMTAISIFRVENGKIVECWSERDRLGRLHQLGVLAPLAESFAQAPAPDAPAPHAPTQAA